MKVFWEAVGGRGGNARQGNLRVRAVVLVTLINIVVSTATEVEMVV